MSSVTFATVHPGAATAAAPRALADATPSWGLLVLGVLGTLLTGPRYGVAALAWLAPIPYLLYARRARGWRAWLLMGGLLVVAHIVQLYPIATPPVPPLAIIPFGGPVGLAALIAIAGAEWLRRRTGETVAVLGYASLVVVTDWLLYRHTELGAWTATGNSQSQLLPLMQVLSLAGLAGLGFLMAWFAALAASLLGARHPVRRWRHGVALVAVLGAVLVYGAIRLDHTHGRSVMVGAVVTDLGPSPQGVPPPEVLAANNDTLFERTHLAARRGARLVVWNEVATMTERDDEAALIERGRQVAVGEGIDLVLAYGVILSRTPLRIDNKYVFLTSEGELVDQYSKHHPVPGEFSVPGHGPLRVVERPYARIGGAICYDYDFPAMGLEHGARGAELVVLPSSDWRGIDPIHTWMARQRAIENGFSLVRATRWGASGAFDAYGRVRGWMLTTEPNDRVMVASVPVGRVATLYGAIGDTPVALAAGFALFAFGLAGWRRRRPRA